MTWENIIKADFSFRDVIKDSRGIYSKVLGRIQITPQLTELGGNLLGDALKSLEGEEGLTVTNKRKIAEVVLLEPMLIGLDMMNDPEMEDQINVIERDTVSDIGPKDEKDSSDSNSEELIQALQKVIDDSAAKVMSEFRNEITEIVDKKMPEISSQKKHELTQAIMPVIKSGAFVDYIAIITSALIRKMTDDSKKLSQETEPDIDITDDKFSEAFQQANKMDWKNILKQNRRFNTLGEAKTAAKELAQQQNKVQIIARLPQSRDYAVEDNLSAFLSEDRNFKVDRDVLGTSTTEGLIARFNPSDFMLTDRQRLFGMRQSDLERLKYADRR